MRMCTETLSTTFVRQRDSTHYNYTPNLINLDGGNLIKSIFAYYNSSALLDSKGSLFVCGDNAFRKLGIANKEKIVYFQKLHIINEQILTVNIGINHTMIITESKQIIAIGRNTEGQFGVGNCKACTIPQIIKSPPGVTMITCGETYTAAGTDSNSLYVWGAHLKVITPQTEFFEKTGEATNESQVLELILKPRCILALYSSEERLKAGHKIWLGSVLSVSNHLLVLVHTTAPPPLKRVQSSNVNKKYERSSCFPDWMDTNLDYSTLTTLPNTPQFT